MEKKVQYGLIGLCVVVFGYIWWIDTLSYVDYPTVDVYAFREDEQNLNIKLVADVEAAHKAPYFSKRYTVYKLKDAKPSNYAVGVYLEFRDCNVDSRKSSTICDAVTCDNTESINKIERGETPSVSDLLDRCDEAPSKWRVEVRP